MCGSSLDAKTSDYSPRALVVAPWCLLEILPQQHSCLPKLHPLRETGPTSPVLRRAGVRGKTPAAERLTIAGTLRGAHDHPEALQGI